MDKKGRRPVPDLSNLEIECILRSQKTSRLVSGSSQSLGKNEGGGPLSVSLCMEKVRKQRRKFRRPGGAHEQAGRTPRRIGSQGELLPGHMHEINPPTGGDGGG